MGETKTKTGVRFKRNLLLTEVVGAESFLLWKSHWSLVHSWSHFKLGAKVANDLKSSVSCWKVWPYFSWVFLQFFVFSQVFLVYYGWCSGNNEEKSWHAGFFCPFPALPISLSGPEPCSTDLTFMLMSLFDVLIQTIYRFSWQIFLGLRF